MPTIICKERITGEAPLETCDGTTDHLTFVEEVRNHDEGMAKAEELSAQTGRTHKALSYP